MGEEVRLSWEYEYFGRSGVDPLADPDGDGLNNQQENADGTNPQVSDLPKIQFQPHNQLVEQGSNATFTVAATGTGSLTYQWGFNGTSIAGATGSSFTVSNAQLANCGPYYVTVTDTYGSTTGTNAYLSVAIPGSGLPQGIVAWWPGESNTTDIIGENNGTWYNGALYSTGKVNYAFQFNGTNSFIEVPDAPALELTNALTIEFWVQRLRTNGNYEYLVEKGGAWNAGYQNYALQIHGADNGLCLTWNGGYSIAGVINDLNWHHCAAVATNGTTTPAFYIDGVQQSISSGSGGNINMVASTRPLHIGAEYDTNSGWNFYSETIIDELSIYNRGLSASEIQSIYNAGSAGKTKAPVITSQPASQTVPVGGTATFAVSATGTTPFSYQWTFNGTAISGATASSYTVANAQSGNVGYYAVVVANSGGSVLSAKALLSLVNSCVVSPLNLVSWWRAEGTPTDSVGTNNGTLMGAATYATGEVGQGFSLNGSSGCYVQVPSSVSLQLSNAFTLEFWYEDKGNSGWYDLVAKRSATSLSPLQLWGQRLCPWKLHAGLLSPMGSGTAVVQFGFQGKSGAAIPC